MSNIPFTTTSLEGRSSEVHDRRTARDAVDAAFDYRGDVTVELRTGQKSIGYLFHRDWTRGDGVVDILPHSGGVAERILVCDIVRIYFSGKDSASGKNWESWLARVAEAEARGEIAELYPDQAA